MKPQRTVPRASGGGVTAVVSAIWNTLTPNERRAITQSVAGMSLYGMNLAMRKVISK